MKNRLDDLRDRYVRDAEFHALVDLMIGFVYNTQATPDELRDAAFLASLIHQERTPISHVINESQLDEQIIDQIKRPQ